MKISKKGQKVRKGKAMLKIHMIRLTNSYIPCDTKGKFMPAADKAEWLISTCLNRDGSSGYLGPGDIMHILD